MEFYQKLVNIREKDLEKEVRESLKVTREHYADLTTERTCFIYSSKIYEELRSRGVSCNLMNTNDLGLSYLHYFVMVPFGKDDFYLVDPTYEQFCLNNDNDIFSDLIDKGYILVGRKLLRSYLDCIGNCDKFIKRNM